MDEIDYWIGNKCKKFDTYWLCELTVHLLVKTYIEKRIWSSYEEYRIAMMRMFFDGYITVIFYHFPLNPIYILSYILLKIISIS